ncbi:substrate-binding periplasmic protein [Chitinimonas naiadis]
MAQPLLLRTTDVDNNLFLFNRGDQQLPGVCVDVMQAIEQADPAIRFTTESAPLPLVRLQIYVQKGSLDVLCGLLKTSDRKANFIFPATALFQARHRLAVRVDEDAAVHGFDDLRKLGPKAPIMTTQGSAFASYLREQELLWVDPNNKDSSIMLRRLAEGYGRFFYGGEAAIRTYIRREGLQDKLKLLPTVFREEPVYFVFGKHLPAQDVKRLEAVLAQLGKQGVLKRIYQRYTDEEGH